MSDVVGGPRPGPWVVASFAWVGLLLLIGILTGITVVIVGLVRGPDTYEAAKLVLLDEAAMDSIESIADSESFRLELADAAGISFWGVEVDACRPGEVSALQVSVRHHDRRSTVALLAQIVPTLNDQFDGEAFPPEEGARDPVHEIIVSGARIVDPDEAPRCDLEFPF